MASPVERGNKAGLYGGQGFYGIPGANKKPVDEDLLANEMLPQRSNDFESAFTGGNTPGTSAQGFSPTAVGLDPGLMGSAIGFLSNAVPGPIGLAATAVAQGLQAAGKAGLGTGLTSNTPGTQGLPASFTQNDDPISQMLGLLGIPMGFMTTTQNTPSENDPEAVTTVGVPQGEATMGMPAGGIGLTGVEGVVGDTSPSVGIS